MASNKDIVRGTYEASAAEKGERLRAALAPDASWTEAAGFPYAGTYVGFEAIAAGVFLRLGTEWIDYRARLGACPYGAVPAHWPSSAWTMPRSSPRSSASPLMRPIRE